MIIGQSREWTSVDRPSRSLLSVPPIFNCSIQACSRACYWKGTRTSALSVITVLMVVVNPVRMDVSLEPWSIFTTTRFKQIQLTLHKEWWESLKPLHNQSLLIAMVTVSPVCVQMMAESLEPLHCQSLLIAMVTVSHVCVQMMAVTKTSPPSIPTVFNGNSRVSPVCVHMAESLEPLEPLHCQSLLFLMVTVSPVSVQMIVESLEPLHHQSLLSLMVTVSPKYKQ